MQWGCNGVAFKGEFAIFLSIFTIFAVTLHVFRPVSIHALVRVRLLNVYGLIINSATGVLRQPPMGGTKIPGREKEMIVVKIRTPTDYENRRCPGNFL